MKNLFKGKRVVCFCDSPFQTIGLISLFSLSENRDFIVCDVLVNPTIPDAQAIAERLSQEDLFSSVILGIANIDEIHGHLGFEWMTSRRFRNKLKDDLLSCFPSLAGRNYDVLVCSAAVAQTLAIKHFFVPDGYSVFFDDGTGSHNGNVFMFFSCQDDVLAKPYRSSGMAGRLKTIAKKTLCKLPCFDYRYDIRALWLFSPTENDSAMYTNLEIRPIPIPDDVSILRRVLAPDIQEEAYSKKRLILLTNSRACRSDDVKSAEVRLAKTLNEFYGDQFGVRVHPNRDIEDFSICKDAILPSRDSWELLLMSGVIDENVILLAYSSSAQIHPKMIFGLEPPVVFLYDLFGAAIGDDVTVLDQTMRNLREAYERKDLIMVPRDYDELFSFLKQE